MTRVLGAILIACLCAAPAWATGQIKLRAAGGVPSLGTGCAPVQRIDTGGVLEWVMNCTGGPSLNGFTLATNYPADATQPEINVNYWLSSPDASPTGFACGLVCAGVIRTGQSAADVDMSACWVTLVNQVFSSQLTEYYIQQGLITLVPKDTTGTPCDVVSCANAELLINVSNINDDGNCPGHSPNSRDFHGVIVEYH